MAQRRAPGAQLNPRYHKMLALLTDAVVAQIKQDQGEPPPGNETYMSDLQLAKRYGVARPTIWRWAAQGHLPKPVKLSPGCTRWAKSEVEAADVKRRRRK